MNAALLTLRGQAKAEQLVRLVSLNKVQPVLVSHTYVTMVL